MAGKIFITGAFGIVGTALADLPGEKVLFDRQIPAEFQGKPNVVHGDIQDRTLLEKSMQGCATVVHLAASASVESSWEQVLQNNIFGTQILLKVAAALKVERVIFASTNHVVGMYELHNKPQIYEPGHGIMLTKDVEPLPDSSYGVSKLLGESLGRYMAEKENGPKFYALRIGTVLRKEHEYLYGVSNEDVKEKKYEAGSDDYIQSAKRLQATWLSGEDLVQLVQLCVDYQGPPFDIFYGVSDNPTRWLDIEYAKKQLGYKPQDSGARLKAAPVMA